MVEYNIDIQLCLIWTGVRPERRELAYLKDDSVYKYFKLIDIDSKEGFQGARRHLSVPLRLKKSINTVFDIKWCSLISLYEDDLF